VSATAIAATAPVLAGHGLGTSPFGLLANVAAVPWTAAVLLPGSLLASAEAWLLPGASLALPGLARIAEASLDAAGRIAGALPVAGASAPGAAGLALAVGLAALALRARRTLMRAALAAAVCGALSAAPPADVSPPAPRAVVLDVGLGDAVIVQGRRGALLVDGGWALPDGADLGRSVVVPALRALGVRRLDAAVATHADLDHRGGLGSVLRALPVGELWLPAGGGDDLAPLRAQAARLGIPVRELRRGDRVGPLGELEVEVLWPPEPTGIAPAASRNDASLVLRVETAGTRLLLTGDVGAATEAALLASGSPLRADVLKVAHHGSAGSSSAAFLAAVAPRWALVSAPCGGRLPSARTLARLQAAGAEVAWTGRDGALRVGLGARGPDVRSAPRRAGCQAP